MLGGPLLHALRRVHRKQKIVERTHAVRGRLLALQALAQGGKRRDGTHTQLVQLAQLRPGGVIERNAVAIRMLDPVALPRRTAYLPRDDVVFEPVDFIVLQTRETCLEAAEQLLVAEIRADAFERTHDERHRRTGQQVGLVREEHRDVIPPHRHGERGAVRRNIARRNNEIAVARALVAHLASDIGRGVFALVKGRCRLVEPDAGSVLVRAANGQKRLLRHGGKSCGRERRLAPRFTISGRRSWRSAMRVSVRSVLQPVTNTSGSSVSQVTAAVSGTFSDTMTSMMASSCGV